MVLEILVSLSIVVGSFFILVGAIGLVRLGDVYSRLHGPTKATTVGMGALLFGSLIVFSDAEVGISVHEILVTAFLFLTAPAGAHMLARAALHLRVASVTRPLEARYATTFPGAVDPSIAPAHTPGDPGAAR